MVSNLGRCGGPDRTDFSQFHTLSRWGGPDRTAFLHSFYFGRVWCLERTDF